MPGDEYDEMPRCDDCGHVHGRDGRPTCSAHTRRDGVRMPCRNYPIAGGRVCRFHGGAARQVRARAAEREATAAVDRILRYELGEVYPEHLAKSPDEQLLEEVARSAQAVQWLASRVAELNVPNPEDIGAFADLAGIDEEGDPIVLPNRFNLYGPDHNGDLGIHPLWKKLDEERDRHVRMAKLAIDAGISERLVRIVEAQAQAVVAVILATIDKLGLPPNLREKARKEAATQLRNIGPMLEVTSRDG